MPVTASGLFVQTFVSVLGATQLAVDLSLTSNKVALFTNSITPDFDASTALAAYGSGAFSANEVSGAGYSAGGTAVSTPALTGSSGTMAFDLDDTTWAGATITNARCALLYAAALAGKNAICLVNFGADYSTVAGAFTIQWPLAGMFTVDWTP